MKRFLIVVALVASAAQGRELSWIYVVPAAANTLGKNGTDWHTDLTLVNPHQYSLPIVLQFLPSGQDNRGGVPTVTFDLFAYESLNLWDVLGPNGFDARGRTGALLVMTDGEKTSCPSDSVQCDFVVFSRTYTIGPLPGEFGQALPGFPAGWGMDSTVLAYLPQLSNDADFRTNLGAASLADDFVEVGYDVQAPDGQILARESTWIAPFGHAQWGLSTTITGGSVVFYIKSGPQGAMLYPYASVVNQRTGDPVYVEAHMTVVGVSAQGLSARALSKSPALPPRLPAPSFRLPR